MYFGTTSWLQIAFINAVHPVVLRRDVAAYRGRAPLRRAPAPSGTPGGLDEARSVKVAHVDLPMKTLLIFDFDGVLADSEILANAVLAEMSISDAMHGTRRSSQANVSPPQHAHPCQRLRRDAPEHIASPP